MRAPRRSAGFSIIEVIAATAILLLIAAVSMEITSGSDEHSERALRARELRYLAELKLKEVKLFAEEFDDILEDDFRDLEDERFEGFRWQLDIRDVVMFGEGASQEAEYYFEEPSAEEETEATTPTPSQSANAKPQELRELTLRVTAPTEEGPADFIELVVLLPLVR